MQARKQNNDWSDAMHERLRAYRADPALLVSSAAEFTFAQGEDDEDEDDDSDDFDDYGDSDDEDEDL
jgi:phenolic acid decarboxylase